MFVDYFFFFAEVLLNKIDLYKMWHQKYYRLKASVYFYINLSIYLEHVFTLIITII